MKTTRTFFIVGAMLLGIGTAHAAASTTYLISSPVWSRDGQDHANLDVWLDPDATVAISVIPTIIGGSGTVLPANTISCGTPGGQGDYVIAPGGSCHMSVSLRGDLATAKLRIITANLAEVKLFVRAGVDVRDAGENSLIHAELR
jgi:hypothetical protein